MDSTDTDTHQPDGRPRRLELADGQRIEPVTRVTRGDDGLLNVHTPGSGYRPVDPDDVVRDTAGEYGGRSG